MGRAIYTGGNGIKLALMPGKTTTSTVFEPEQTDPNAPRVRHTDGAVIIGRPVFGGRRKP